MANTLSNKGGYPKLLTVLEMKMILILENDGRAGGADSLAQISKLLPSQD